MRSDRTAALRRRFEGRIDSIHTSAIRHQHTWGEIQKWLNWDVYNKDEFKRLPDWARTALFSYAHGCRSMLEAMHLEWRLLYLGKYVHRDKIPDGKWRDVDGGSHFYIGTDVEYWPEGERSDDYERGAE